MHEIVYVSAIAWLTALLAVCAAAVIRLRRAPARILALDTLTLTLAALLIVHASYTGSAYYLDTALVLVLLAFISTVAAARFFSERSLF